MRLRLAPCGTRIFMSRVRLTVLKICVAIERRVSEQVLSVDAIQVGCENWWGRIVPGWLAHVSQHDCDDAASIAAPRPERHWRLASDWHRVMGQHLRISPRLATAEQEKEKKKKKTSKSARASRLSTPGHRGPLLSLARAERTTTTGPRQGLQITYRESSSFA